MGAVALKIHEMWIQKHEVLLYKWTKLTIPVHEQMSEFIYKQAKKINPKHSSGEHTLYCLDF